MKLMNDKKLIIIGLLIFFGVCSSVCWYNWLSAAEKGAPEPLLSEKAKAAGYCVVPKDKMKAEHMKILDQWREHVVRTGKREYVIPETGRTFNMSLSTGEDSCMGCHSNKSEFCDRCHDYASVKPYCWDCHLEPKEKE